MSAETKIIISTEDMKKDIFQIIERIHMWMETQ